MDKQSLKGRLTNAEYQGLSISGLAYGNIIFSLEDFAWQFSIAGGSQALGDLPSIEDPIRVGI